jgi:RNA polymerase sigma-70 factor (ECF subfamily)
MDMHDPAEQDLIVALKNGEQRAIEHLYRLHYRPLCFFAQGFINNKEESEDIVVNVFVKFLHRKQDFETLNKIKAFLYISTRNACLDFLKHVRRKTASHNEIAYLMEKEEDFIQSRIIRAELLKMVLHEVDQLPALRKKICKMIFVDDLSNIEIAQKLNITVDSVRVHKARAIESLRTVFLKNRLLSVTLTFFLQKITSHHCHVGTLFL